MREAIQKYLTVISIIIFSVWLGHSPSWEPITGLIAVLIGYVALDVFVKKENNHDRVLFNTFLEVLPSQGSIKFINEWNMAGFSFPWSALEQLKSFQENWDIPEHKFLNTHLEKLRSNLHKKISEYLGYLAVNTWIVDGSKELRSSVPEEWETEQPERFKEVVNKLHGLSDEIVSLHRDLVKLGIKKGLKNY